ncbi:MAG: UPF0262 family protein [Hyphomicrobiaceae bacterium]
MSDHAPAPSNARLIEVTLDEKSLGRGTADIEHEREVAIYDLLEANSFALEGREDGPYKLALSIAEDRLVFSVGTSEGPAVATHLLSLSPFRRIVKDYFLICESYFKAIKTAPISRIEAIDMGRRGLHDEGSKLLQERLQGKISVDFPTARRLFTLVCALHWKG